MLSNYLDDLDFISKIKKGEKPCFSDKTCVGVNEWFATFKRRWKNELGEKGVIYVNNLLDCISSYVKTENKEHITIREKLLLSLNGIHNIVYTYKVDNQDKVAKDYFDCTVKIEKLINLIDEMKEKSRKNDLSFFTLPYSKIVGNLQ